VEVRWSSKVIKTKVSFSMYIPVDDIVYEVTGVAEETPERIEKLQLQEVIYRDPLGEIRLEEKSKTRFKKLLKENLVGTFTNGIAINKPFYIKLRNFTP